MPTAIGITSARPIGIVLVTAIVVAYILIGLTGHDPWKQDETYIFGIIQEILENGDWVIPRVAGEPFMEKPPLFHWVATIFAIASRQWLSLHDGARLASGVFVAISALTVGWTAKNLWGNGAGRYSVLIFLGSIGMGLYAHLMITDLPVVAGTAIACSAIIFLRTHVVRAGLLLGTGVGMGFLGKGLFLPGVVTITALILSVLFKQWRCRATLKCVIFASIASLPWLLVWPISLYVRSPTLFHEWFWMNNVGRFLGFSVELLGSPNSHGYWFRTLPWFTFPVAPLAMIGTVKKFNIAKTDARLQFLATLVTVMTATLFYSASARASYALPLLVPLALLGAQAAHELPMKIDAVFDWFGRVLFWCIAITVWTTWLLVASGHVLRWKWLTEKLPANTVGSHPIAIVTGVLLTISIAVITTRLTQIRGRGVVGWTIGFQLSLGLLLTIWLPWLDEAKSYRSVFMSMRQAMPNSSGCMQSVGLGESERAMLRYVLGINTLRYENVIAPSCELFLIEGLAATPPITSDMAGWVLLWDGARPTDTRERLWLYERAL